MGLTLKYEYTLHTHQLQKNITSEKWGKSYLNVLDIKMMRVVYGFTSKTNLVVFYWNLDEQPPALPSKLTLDNVV